MVTSWILNLISKDLVDGFIYTTSARDLWLEITEKFEECNGMMIYQSHRKIFLIVQENASVSVYFTRIKRLWDELGSMETLPPCTCSTSKAIYAINSRNKLMQFLMGLDGAYNPVRDQILRLDPLPFVNKAYSMVLKFKSQKEVLGTMSNNMDSLVLLNKAQGQFQGKQRKFESRKGHYSYCDMNSHVRESYFKLIGYPEWYKIKNKTGG